jgi:hypothetical protein
MKLCQRCKDEVNHNIIDPDSRTRLSAHPRDFPMPTKEERERQLRGRDEWRAEAMKRVKEQPI